MKVCFTVLSLFVSSVAMASRTSSDFNRAVLKGADASITLSVVNDDGVRCMYVDFERYPKQNYEVWG